MPLQNINVVNASLQLTASTALDYSTVLIVDAHHLSSDRATVFTEMPSTTTIPDGTNLRKMLVSAFSAEVKPEQVILGRSKGKAIIDPDLSDFSDVSFIVTTATASETISETAAGGETEQDVLDRVKITLDTTFSAELTVTVTGTGADAVLEVETVSSSDDFTVTNTGSNVVVNGESQETPATTLDAIKDFNKDWTYIVSTDHTPSYQQAMAEAANVLQKPYVTSTDNPAAYAAWDGESQPDANDVPALFKFENNNYAHCIYHHEASDYPEAIRITRFTSTRPGTNAFQYKDIGFPVAHIQDVSRPLNGTELAALESKNASTVISLNKTPVIAGNRMSSGIRIEAIVFKSYAVQELKRRTDSLFIRLPKMGMNDSDIGRIENSWKSFLEGNVSSESQTRGLDPYRPYVITMPKAKDISFQDRVDGVLRCSAILYLDPSIDSTVLNLTFTYRDPAQGQ